MTYKAAVIIPTRGGASKLHYPLDSLTQQTNKDFQVIVVVDGDIDGSAQVIDHYIAQGILNITKIVFPENQGRVAALNAGYKAATADVLIRCDDDIEMLPDYISNHLSYHQGAQEVGVMGLVHNLYPDTPHARAYGHYRDQKFREDAYTTPEEQRWHFWAANCSMSRKMFQAIGGYDDRYQLYGWEDVDMGKMLAEAGVKMILSKELEVKHHIAATTTAIKARRALYSGAARNIFVEKHGAGVLPDINPQGLWGMAVKTTAVFITEKFIKTVGDSIDKIADRVSQKIAEKMISLLVEAAIYAGASYPHRAQKKF